MFVTESWLNAEVSDGLLDPLNKFRVFRTDRIDLSGGGVCVFIRNYLSIRNVEMAKCNLHTELLCVDIFNTVVSYRFSLVYRPPDDSGVYKFINRTDYMHNLICCFEQHINVKGPSFILGDFNCPSIDWKTLETPRNNVALELYNFVLSNGFTQVVDKPTRGSNYIDLILTNQPSFLAALQVEPPFSHSDHNAVSFFVCFDEPVPHTSVPVSRRFLWRKGDYINMSKYLSCYNWSDILTSNFTPDDIWRNFCVVLNQAIELFVPSIEVYNGRNYCKGRKYPANIRALFVRKRCLWRCLIMFKI